MPIPLTVVSDTQPQVRHLISTMTRIANLQAPTNRDRRAYLDAMVQICGLFPITTSAVASWPTTFCIAPRREGHLLAALTGGLPAGRSAAPDAKRIPFEGGLLIGVSELEPISAETLLLIDGAIATASTLMTLVAAAANEAMGVRVHAVHATPAGLRAIKRFAEDSRLSIRVDVGHVAGSLDDRFYARHNSDLLVVGDIGDIIAPLYET